MNRQQAMRSIAALMCLAIGGCSDLVDATGILQQDVSGASLSTAATFDVGAPITVDFSGFDGSATDWIAIADPAADDTVYLAYRFTGGGDAGSVSFNSGLPPGTYEARAYFDWEGTQSYDRQATTTFTVAAPSGPPISTNASHYAIGAAVTVTFSGMPGTPTDWIGIAAPGSDPEQWIRYQFTDGSTAGEVTFNSLPAGTFVARSFRENTYEMVAESAAFTIGNVVETSQTSYVETASIVVSYSGLTTDPTDWIALAPAGAPDTTFVAWRFQNGTGAGTITFDPLPPGNYEARAFLHNSFESAGGSYSFSVTSALPPSVISDKPSYTEGETVAVTYANLTGNQYDWVAISTAGSGDTEFVQWKWVDPTGTSSFSGLVAGDYEARIYADNGFTIIATYAFSVAPAGPAQTIGTTSDTYAAGQDVVVNYTGLGGLEDWIGISPAGSPDTTYVAYVYTTQPGGQVTFPGLPPGDYEVRGYIYNSYQVVVRATFSITP